MLHASQKSKGNSQKPYSSVCFPMCWFPITEFYREREKERERQRERLIYDSIGNLGSNRNWKTV